MTRRAFALAAAALALLAARAPDGPVSRADGFRVGTTGVLCTAQRRTEDPHYASPFDRAYELTCRDAAVPVGMLYVLNRARPPSTDAGCEPPMPADGLPAGTQRQRCPDAAAGLARYRYTLRRGGRLFAADGLAAYDAALRLGLRSLVDDRPAAGAVEVATTGAGDPAALARLQAERLDPAQALATGYRRANDGAYVEAAQFFDALAQRGAGTAGDRRREYLADLAMSQSVLGERAEADALFARAERAAPADDPNEARLLRNLRAMHRLAGGDPAGALAVLDEAVGVGTPTSPDRLAQGYIDRPLAQRLTLDDAVGSRLLGASQALTETERAALLDAQAQYLRGAALRLRGDPAGARAALARALAAYRGVRGGQVVSMAWLPAGVATEDAALAAAAGDHAAEGADLARAVALLAPEFPDTAALLAARARLAAWQVAHGRRDEGLTGYRALVAGAATVPDGAGALRGRIGPYLDALVAAGDRPGAAADFFAASQLLVRPGLAQTQAVLARELSAGSDEAAGLFRQSLNLSREVIALDADLGRLAATEDRTPADEAALAAARVRRAAAAAAQTAVVARLAAFPQYRAVSNDAVDLATLRAALRPGEAYYQLVLAGDAAYALLARPDGAHLFRLPTTPARLAVETDAIRASVVRSEGGQLVTDPFDVAAARDLYLQLFGPAAAGLADVHHLVFEPAGALLKLPITLLVAEQAGVDAYLARQRAAGADPFDFSGVAWLARTRIVSTAVSARSFLQVRAIAPSRAPRAYLGLGHNQPASASPFAPAAAGPRDPCDWPLDLWNHPVSAAGLTVAERALGGTGDRIVTGAAFTDTALRDAHDLADYRVVEFATHGLVTAPRAGCPARPALLTSWGPAGSDGLLGFREIFDLRFNADTVVLSACDTAGAATAAATREAGVGTGGGFALDGLVRAFTGAGARGVVASHWPVPDDFHATERLIGGLYRGAGTVAVGEAMRAAQLALMDDPVTSHPYYWAAFAIVGDAAKPLTSR